MFSPTLYFLLALLSLSFSPSTASFPSSSSSSSSSSSLLSASSKQSTACPCVCTSIAAANVACTANPTCVPSFCTVPAAQLDVTMAQCCDPVTTMPPVTTTTTVVVTTSTTVIVTTTTTVPVTTTTTVPVTTTTTVAGTTTTTVADTTTTTTVADTTTTTTVADTTTTTTVAGTTTTTTVAGTTTTATVPVTGTTTIPTTTTTGAVVVVDPLRCPCFCTTAFAATTSCQRDVFRGCQLAKCGPEFGDGVYTCCNPVVTTAPPITTSATVVAPPFRCPCFCTSASAATTACQRPAFRGCAVAKCGPAFGNAAYTCCNTPVVTTVAPIVTTAAPVLPSVGFPNNLFCPCLCTLAFRAARQCRRRSFLPCTLSPCAVPGTFRCCGTGVIVPPTTPPPTTTTTTTTARVIAAPILPCPCFCTFGALAIRECRSPVYTPGRCSVSRCTGFGRRGRQRYQCCETPTVNSCPCICRRGRFGRRAVANECFSNPGCSVRGCGGGFRRGTSCC